MLKNTGYERKLDNLGRLVLPVEVSQQLGIATGDTLCVWLDIDSQEIILKKAAKPAPNA